MIPFDNEYVAKRERKRQRGTTKRICGASLHSTFGDSDIELAISSNLRNVSSADCFHDGSVIG